MYIWDLTKNWLGFGDLDLIFKITAVEKLKIHSKQEKVLSFFFKHFVMSPHLSGGWHIDFSMDPFGVNICVGVSVAITLSCLHNIL